MIGVTGAQNDFVFLMKSRLKVARIREFSYFFAYQSILGPMTKRWILKMISVRYFILLLLFGPQIKLSADQLPGQNITSENNLGGENVSLKYNYIIAYKVAQFDALTVQHAQFTHSNSMGEDRSFKSIPLLSITLRKQPAWNTQSTSFFQKNYFCQEFSIQTIKQRNDVSLFYPQNTGNMMKFC